jgi:hypothetical protein
LENPKERNHLDDLGAEGKNTVSIKAQSFWTKLETTYLQEGGKKLYGICQAVVNGITAIHTNKYTYQREALLDTAE